MYPTGGVGSARLGGGGANSCGRSSGRSSDILSIWLAGATLASVPIHSIDVQRPAACCRADCRMRAFGQLQSQPRRHIVRADIPIKVSPAAQESCRR